MLYSVEVFNWDEQESYPKAQKIRTNLTRAEAERIATTLRLKAKNCETITVVLEKP